jgi:hypothetical protein
MCYGKAQIQHGIYFLTLFWKTLDKLFMCSKITRAWTHFFLNHNFDKTQLGLVSLCVISFGLIHEIFMVNHLKGPRRGGKYCSGHVGTVRAAGAAGGSGCHVPADKTTRHPLGVRCGRCGPLKKPPIQKGECEKGNDFCAARS